MVGGYHGVLLLSAKRSRSLLTDGKTPYEWRFGMPFDGPVTPFGALVEHHPVSSKDQSRLQFGPKVLPGICFEYALHAGGIWKGDIMIADIEELEEMDASELHARRLNAKEVLTPMKSDNFIFPVSDGTVKTPGGDRRLKPTTFIKDRPERGNLPVKSDGLYSPNPLQDDSTRDDAEAKKDFWSITGDFILSTSRGTQSNCTCREKNHFFFRRNTLTYPE